VSEPSGLQRLIEPACRLRIGGVSERDAHWVSWLTPPALSPASASARSASNRRRAAGRGGAGMRLARRLLVLCLDLGIDR
jgi:hypothetical protein